MNRWMPLVSICGYEISREYHELYDKQLQITKRMNAILIHAATKAQMRVDPEIRYFQFAYMDTKELNPITPCSNDRIKYETFTIDASKLYDIIKPHIIRYMEDGIMPRPNTMVIGTDLQDAVIDGYLPKRFRARIMDFDIRYDSGINGVMFLE